MGTGCCSLECRRLVVQLHGVAKEMALRLKTENAPQHARALLDADTRLQAECARHIGSKGLKFRD